MSSDGLSELFTFTPKKIPPFSEVKSGFKYYPIEPTANGKLRIRLFLYDETQQDESELHLVITQEVYDTYHHSIHEYLVAKLGLSAIYVEPEPVSAQEPVQEPVEEPVVEEPVEEPVVEEPVAEEPVAEEPVTEEPVVEEPVAPVEEPVTEEPVTEEPVAPVEEPVAEEPVTEEPVVEEPVAPVEEPVTEEPVTEEPVAPVEEPVAEEPVAPVQEPVQEPVTVVEIKPVYYYLILDSANRMVFPQGFARNASLEIVDTDSVPIVFAQMKLGENNTPLIYNLLPTNAEHIPSLPQGASKTSEGHILTPDGSEIVITYPQFVATK